MRLTFAVPALAALAALATLVSCKTAPGWDSGNDDTSALTVTERLGLTDEQVTQILVFVNDCVITQQVFDDEVPLDADTAENIVAHRDGPDATCGTGDDDPFDNIDELDFVPQVGDASITAILTYVLAGGYVDTGGGTWEGVTFNEDEVAVVLDIANLATLEQLDIDADIDSDSATSIIDHRPYDDMDQLADAPEVGAGTLQKLKDYIGTWQSGG